MSLMDDLRTKAESNGDGKLSSEDLEAMKTDDNRETIDKLKAKADQTDDGRLNFDDIKQIDFTDAFSGIRKSF